MVAPEMDARAYAIAMVEREQAEWEAAEAAIASGLARRTRRRSAGSSVVYTLRLDRGELHALESRAAAMQLKPSVLARNLIRNGLRGPADLAANDAVDRLVGAADELRGMIT